MDFSPRSPCPRNTARRFPRKSERKQRRFLLEENEKRGEKRGNFPRKDRGTTCCIEREEEEEEKEEVKIEEKEEREEERRG